MKFDLKIILVIIIGLTVFILLPRKEKETKYTIYPKYIQYIKDDKTGFCFATIPVKVNSITQGIGLTYIPCDSIPEELILISK